MKRSQPNKKEQDSLRINKQVVQGFHKQFNIMEHKIGWSGKEMNVKNYSKIIKVYTTQDGIYPASNEEPLYKF